MDRALTWKYVWDFVKNWDGCQPARFAVYKAWLCLLISLFKLEANNPSWWSHEFNKISVKGSTRPKPPVWTAQTQDMCAHWNLLQVHSHWRWRFCWKSKWSHLWNDVLLSPQLDSKIGCKKGFFGGDKAEVNSKLEAVPWLIARGEKSVNLQVFNLLSVTHDFWTWRYSIPPYKVIL